MWASVQYFLCGIPLVTTKSRGGRDFFYDSDFVTIVRANPSAIEKAVERYKVELLDPDMIRSKTLQKMISHRYDYLNILKSFLGNEFDQSEKKLYKKLWGAPNGIKNLIYEVAK